MNLRERLNEILSSARDGLVYDEDKPSTRSRLLTVFASVLAVLDNLDQQEASGQVRSRFCLRLPATQVWVSESEGRLYEGDNGRYMMTPVRCVYFIDGYVTESKILAIKQVRTLDNSGLKDAKDYVDGLQARAVTTSK